MGPTLNSVLVADVRASDNTDALVITPRNRSDGHRLARSLRIQLGQVRLRQRAEGILLSNGDAPRLLDPNDALDLRWTAEAKMQAQNRRRAQTIMPVAVEAVRRFRTQGLRAADQHLAGQKLLAGLDEHQRVNVAAMTLEDSLGLCLYDEQGTGKTVTTIAAADVLIGLDKVDFVLIVAPKSMVGEWPRDIERFAGGLYSVKVVTGTRREKLVALRSGADILVTNFETAVAFERHFEAMLRRHQGRALLVVDESFYIKNLDAKRTRVLRRLREWCGRAFVLCGTPAPNSPSDVIQQFNIMDFGFTFSGVSIPKDRASARGVIRGAMADRGCYMRHLKQDVLPLLPAKTFNRLLVPLEPIQTQMYKGALERLIVELDSVNEQSFRRRLTSFLAQRTALLQICSHPIGLTQSYREIPAKIRALDLLLEDLIAKGGDKVVLWSFFTASLSALCERYERFNPVRYDGSVTEVGIRRDAVAKFQNDSTTMLFIANPAAAGAGLTLHKARFAVYESMSNQAAHYLQSLDRIHRRGQNRGVSYLILLAAGTIELQEYDRLVQKESLAQTLLGDDVSPPVSREGMLREALELRSFFPDDSS